MTCSLVTRDLILQLGASDHLGRGLGRRDAKELFVRYWICINYRAHSLSVMIQDRSRLGDVILI